MVLLIIYISLWGRTCMVERLPKLPLRLWTKMMIPRTVPGREEVHAAAKQARKRERVPVGNFQESYVSTSLGNNSGRMVAKNRCNRPRFVFYLGTNSSQHSNADRVSHNPKDLSLFCQKLKLQNCYEVVINMKTSMNKPPSSWTRKKSIGATGRRIFTTLTGNVNFTTIL
jgi:hypothetical protein